LTMTFLFDGNIMMSISSIGAVPRSTSSPSTRAPTKQFLFSKSLFLKRDLGRLLIKEQI
jgi:hypothetical protein